MSSLWTLPDLVAEVAARIAALPAPKNGQVRAIPDERTVRYYQTIGLLDRPAAMRGRTALYGIRHVAQVVAIKRLQTMGRSLAEIQALWPTLDDPTLSRMSGVELAPPAAARGEFWKRAPSSDSAAAPAEPMRALYLELAPDVVLALPFADGGADVSPADLAAVRAAAAPLLAELAARRLTRQRKGERG